MRALTLRTAATAFATLLFSLTAHADPFGGRNNGTNFEGGVYAMSNKFDGNTIVAYGRRADGTLKLLGEYETGGKGANFDGGEGLDPLISAYSVLLTDDRRHLLAVNAGSDTVSVFRVRNNLALRLTDVVKVDGVGPNSIAYRDGVVYVASIDADGDFAGEPDQAGSLTGFRLTPGGRLRELRQSVRYLNNRPSAIQFSPDGRFLIVASINAGSAALRGEDNEELVVYGVSRAGRLTERPLSTAFSTAVDNAANRNLASAIGFEVVDDEGEQYVVVTEAREFQANGAPPAFDALQTGSVSTWRLEKHGELTPVALDVMTGSGPFDGERTACWIEFSRDGNTFWVSNALEATLSTFSFAEGEIELLEAVAAAGTPPAPGGPAQAFGTTDGWIDLWASDDGEYVYQLAGLNGTIEVFKVIDADGALRLIQTVADLPEVNTQGIVAF